MAVAHQLTLDDAMRARDEGIAQVLENSDGDYRNRYLEAIQLLAARKRVFTADDCRALAGNPPASTHPNLSGALFQQAARAGLIRTVGFVKSPRTVGHANWLRSWIGQ